jgi:iron complex outermembrane receptor protein
MGKTNGKSLRQANTLSLLCIAAAFSVPTIAQVNNAVEDGAIVALEEIVVTGRKREELLQDVPVAISVLNSNVLAEQNVLRQDDLAALVPGYIYNQGVGLNEDRTAALPSIRGIGSTELARRHADSGVDWRHQYRRRDAGRGI